MKHGSQVLLVAFSLFSSTGPSMAWESDVHYGLTRWLAIQAGFSPEQAKWIADGDQGVVQLRIRSTQQSSLRARGQMQRDQVKSTTTTSRR